ncbi:MAG: hypothetical protein ACU0A5_00370 [Salipiger marinus]|uniref:hypothetical protein n=1 Tax=Salipiger marinus TaxID=555512 RepID=UPI00405856B5
MWIESVVAWFANSENALAFSQLAAAAVTAIATIALWRVTRVLAVETKTLAAMTSQPFVVGTIENAGVSAHTVLNFVLRNSGNATAFDVRAKITPAIPNVAGSSEPEPIEEIYELTLLPPGQALPLKGVVLQAIYDKKFEITISWSRRPGEKTETVMKYFINGKDLPNEDWNIKGLHNIAEELEKMRKLLPKQ